MRAGVRWPIRKVHDAPFFYKFYEPEGVVGALNQYYALFTVTSVLHGLWDDSSVLEELTFFFVALNY